MASRGPRRGLPIDVSPPISTRLSSDTPLIASYAELVHAPVAVGGHGHAVAHWGCRNTGWFGSFQIVHRRTCG